MIKPKFKLLGKMVLFAMLYPGCSYGDVRWTSTEVDVQQAVNPSQVSCSFRFENTSDKAISISSIVPGLVV